MSLALKHNPPSSDTSILDEVKLGGDLPPEKGYKMTNSTVLSFTPSAVAPDSKRNLIFVPEINPNTFVLFYYEGDRGSRSYSVRDFPEAQRAATTRYANKFPYTAGEILDLAHREGSYCLPAQVHRVDDIAFWRSEVLRANTKYLESFKEVPSESSGDAGFSAGGDHTAETEPLESSPQTENSAPEVLIAQRTCACGCGMPVNKHDYVWGHKSGSRDSTIPMGAKQIHGNGGFGGGNDHIHLAVEQMREEIAEYEEEIAKRKEAIEALRKLIGNDI
jgi:hypothetical protein